MKTIALCMNVPELYLGGYRDPSVCKRFPGSGWVPHFVRLAEEKGYKVLSGHEAVKTHVSTQNLYVFQEEFNADAGRLITLGAIPWVITSFESKLYSPYFYDLLQRQEFPHKIKLLFEGGTHHLTFPIYEESDVLDPVPWNERKRLVMVCANKFVSHGPTDSPNFLEAKEFELQTKRYHATQALQPDLFGHGWPHRPPCEDKIATMRPYKFAVCFENTALPGYITEKIIDCFVAGVIPIYWGAPDVEDYIPAKTMINMAHTPSWGALEEIMNEIDENWAMEKIQAGRAFLKRALGQQHSNAGFAQWMMELL